MACLSFSLSNHFCINFVFRLKSHLATFEPQLDELKTKYDGAMREKMVYKLEKEKLQNELNTLKLGNANASAGTDSSLITSSV